MYKANNIAVTVGGPETTLGTAVARTNRLPVNEFTTIGKVANKAASDVITGRSTLRAKYVDSIDLSLSLRTELHCDKGTGLLLVSNIGQDLATPQQVAGALVLTYTGAEASAKIVVDATTIKAYIGDLGAEEADTNFGTAGTYTLDDIGTDVAAIAGFTGYDCTKLFGADATTTVSKGYAITAAQASGNSVVVYFTSADSGVYLHRFEPVLTSTERPTLSFQVDNTGSSNEVLGGGVVDSIEMSADLKGRVSMTASVIGTTATTDTASSVALATSNPMKFSGSKFYLAGTPQTFVKSISATIANNHSADEGFGAGSLYKQEHAKGNFSATGNLTLRTTSSTETEYAKRITETDSSLTFVFTGDDLATSIPEMMLVRIPHVEVEATKSAGDVGIDTEFTWEMVDPASYDAVLTVDMLTTDSTKYN